ncbi:O-antigen ligase family protein [Clostridium acetobutylicum]|uniref:O-antigen ligase family protein n=2 Tax=Clostridiaceae TaxID=31979 RepID=UPI001F4C586B|nr:O-antigen ligase family protein [Clostridium acetobutylicum]
MRLEGAIKKVYLVVFFLYFASLQLWNNILSKDYSKIQYIIFGVYVIFIFTYFLKSIFSKNRYSTILYVLILIMILYYIFVITNGIEFGNPARMAIGINQYILYSVSFFVPIVILYKELNLKSIEKIFAILLIINFITSVLAAYEYSTGKYIINQNQDIGEIYITGVNMVRAKVFNGSYLSLGGFIGQLAILNLYFLLSNKYKRLKIVFVISFFVDILGIVSTNSRGPFVATGIAISVFFIIYYIYIMGRKQTIYKKICVIILAFFVLILILLGLSYLTSYTGNVNNQVLNYLIYRAKSIFDWNSDGSNLLRKYYWISFINLFRRNFLYGIGISSTGALVDTVSIGPTESGVLKRFVELGIFGAAIYYLFVCIVFVSVFRCLNKLKDNYEKKIVIITLFSAVFCLFINDITYQIFENFQVMFFNWFIYGMLVVMLFKKEKLD